MTLANRANTITKISGLVLGAASFILIIVGVILVASAKKCDPYRSTRQECDAATSKRKTGTILVLTGGIGVVVAGVAIMWKRLFNESALVSAVAAVSAAIAAMAAASAASAAATASSNSVYVQQVSPSPTLIANAEGIYDTINNLRKS